MFTWIIEWKTKITEINQWKFKVKSIFQKDELNIWQSIAHDWACMTLEKIEDETYSFFAMEESLKKTNLGSKKVWDFLNVERCLKLWDRIDWHMVSWHIDCTWTVEEIQKISDGSKIIKIKFQEKFKKLIIEKWSITVSWISLTIINISDDSFCVSVIPLTQKITNLWNIKLWDKVNLEFDMIWKYVNRINKKNE